MEKCADDAEPTHITGGGEGGVGANDPKFHMSALYVIVW